MNITLWYDNINFNNCQHNDLIYPTNMILSKLNNNSIEYKLKNTLESFNESDLNFYIIELCNVKIDFDIFTLIPEHTKSLFSKGLILVLYYPQEGHPLDDWFFRIYKNLIQNNLIDYTIYFVFGDIDFKDNYTEFLAKHKIKSFLTPISMDYFAEDYLEKVDIPNLVLNQVKSHDYLFYNGKLRPHRLYAVSELKRKNILNNGIVSIGINGDTGSFSLKECIEVFKHFDVYDEYLKSFVENFQPLVIDVDAENFSQTYFNSNNILHYEKTYFSLVSETNITTRFITEKIYKPIYNLHPFIIISAPRVLEHLRKKGYLTFSELFNESYDLEDDPVKRINMVINEVENFTKKSKKEKQYLFDKIADKLYFNKNHYIEITKKNKKNEFLKIFRRYKNES